MYSLNESRGKYKKYSQTPDKFHDIIDRKEISIVKFQVN